MTDAARPSRPLPIEAKGMIAGLVSAEVQLGDRLQRLARAADAGAPIAEIFASIREIKLRIADLAEIATNTEKHMEERLAVVRNTRRGAQGRLALETKP